MEDLCVQDFGNKYLSRATRPLGFQHLYKMFSLGILYEESEVNLDSMQQVQALSSTFSWEHIVFNPLCING